jgi:myo-inositol-1(or 4)-monophosphatase
MIDRQRLEAIVREAGALALGRWPGAGHAVESWEKEPGQPVSVADLEVDRFLRRELDALLPSAGWLSEETADGADRLDCSLCWLVDPIDGTRDYLRGRDGWAISVALVSARTPLLGALFAPARGEWWSAEAGAGAYRNGRMILSSRRAKLDGARIPVDRHVELTRPLVRVAKPNSIALRMAMVAADEADVLATTRWGFEWDLAAAALIAREAGAQVTDAFGAPLRFNKRDPRSFGVIVSAPSLHEEVVDWIGPLARRQAGSAG